MCNLKQFELKTISQAVTEYIKTKPFLSSALSDGIINLTSLSRQIKPEIEEILRKAVNHGAIVMALNRLSINLEFQNTHRIIKVLKKIGDITVRSNLVDYNFRVSDSLLMNQSILLKSLNVSVPGIYYFVFQKLSWDGINVSQIISTSNEFTILVNEEEVDKAFSIINRLKSI